jgi:hypothetical protein
VKFDLDDLWIDPPPQPRPILPTLSLGLDEIFVTDSVKEQGSHGVPRSRFGDFMPVLSVKLVRRGSAHQPAAIFSLS